MNPTARGHGRRRPAPPAVVRATTYLHAEQVAALFHVTAKTVARWALAGKLPFVTTPGGHRRFPEQQIRKLAAEHVQTVPPPQEGAPR